MGPAPCQVGTCWSGACELDRSIDNTAVVDIDHLERPVGILGRVCHNNVLVAVDEILDPSRDCLVYLLGVICSCLDDGLNHYEPCDCSSLEVLICYTDAPHLAKKSNSLRQAHGVSTDLSVTTSFVKSNRAAWG